MYRPAYYLTHPWELPGDLWRPVKWRLQRLFTGYSDLDRWNAGDSIARYALPLVEWLRDLDGHGVPYIGEPSDEAFAEWDALEWPDKERLWREVLDKVAYALKATAEDDFDADQARVEEGLLLFGRYLRAMWD
jgi:hypothetical protein